MRYSEQLCLAFCLHCLFLRRDAWWTTTLRYYLFVACKTPLLVCRQRQTWMTAQPDHFAPFAHLGYLVVANSTNQRRMLTQRMKLKVKKTIHNVIAT